MATNQEVADRFDAAATQLDDTAQAFEALRQEYQGKPQEWDALFTAPGGINERIAAKEAAVDAFTATAAAEIAANMDARGGLVPFMTAGGNVSWFFGIPKFKIEDVRPDGELGTGTHPAFIRSGGEYSMLFIGAYLASMKDGEIVCQPNVAPRHSRTMDEEIAECAGTTLGGVPAGAHRLMSIWDRSAVNLLIAANVAAGIPEPIGNTSYGKSHSHPHLRGNGANLTKTGTMGALANHNRESHGIADWAGNVWERPQGIYLQDGEIHLATNNDPAHINAPASTGHYFSSSNTSGNGTPSIVTDAAAVTRNGTVGDDAHGHYDVIGGASGFAALAGASSMQLKLAGIAPIKDGSDLDGAIWVRPYGRRAPLVGGYWGSGALAGCAALYLNFAPSHRSSSFGFRPAFVI